MADPGNLYIRWRQDGGDDNRSDPGSAPFWLSQSVSIHNPKDPTQDPGVAIPGKAQKIRVLVDTKVTTQNVAVQTWVCAFGTAGAPYLKSAGGMAGRLKDRDDSTPPQLLTATQGSQLTVDVDWVPVAQDFADWNLPKDKDLHVCLLANCFATPPGGVADGAQIVAQPPPINVPGNRHHGQHNITLQAVPAGTTKLVFSMFAGNPGDGEELFELEAREIRRPRLPGLRTRILRGRWLDPALDERLGLERLSVNGGVHFPDRPIKKLGLEIGGERGPKVKIPLERDRPQLLTLKGQLPGGEHGALRAFDIVQRRGRRIVGGARVITLSVDERRFEAVEKDRLARA
jgi:hypothetical protein